VIDPVDDTPDVVADDTTPDVIGDTTPDDVADVCVPEVVAGDLAGVEDVTLIVVIENPVVVVVLAVVLDGGGIGELPVTGDGKIIGDGPAPVEVPGGDGSGIGELPVNAPVELRPDAGTVGVPNPVPFVAPVAEGPPLPVACKKKAPPGQSLSGPAPQTWIP